MAALDEAIRRSDFIDPDRLGVLGGSYGGFMTSWTIGHTDRFKAACSERAVNNLLSMYGTSDISPRFLELHQGGTLWDNFQFYLEHSPITCAARVATPVLIVHSENDLRCPVEQAEQYFVTLKRLGKEVAFVRFPDETHELSRSGKPRHRLERFRIILDWFNRYLQPERTDESAKESAGVG
jgi:dipeptidyl aminopeptidase/acylaminoacyl peptidase